MRRHSLVTRSRRLILALLAPAALASAPAGATGYVTKHCVGSSMKIGFHRWGPAACAMQFRCTIVGGCAVYPRAAVRPWFVRGQQGLVRVRGTFVPVGVNVYPGTGTEPQALTCAAPKPSDSNYGYCVAFGDRMVLLENEVVAAACQAPVDPDGIPLLPPKDVAVAEVECAITAYSLFGPF
jgi:hypothetical protein